MKHTINKSVIHVGSTVFYSTVTTLRGVSVFLLFAHKHTPLRYILSCVLTRVLLQDAWKSELSDFHGQSLLVGKGKRPLAGVPKSSSVRPRTWWRHVTPGLRAGPSPTWAWRLAAGLTGRLLTVRFAEASGVGTGPLRQPPRVRTASLARASPAGLVLRPVRAR